MFCRVRRVCRVGGGYTPPYAGSYTVGLLYPRANFGLINPDVGGDPVHDCARREADLADALRQALAPPGAMPWPRAALLADRGPRAVSRQPLAAKK